DEAESSERNQRDPPRLVPKVHIVSDDEATFDCRGRHQDRDDFDVGQGKAVEDRKSTRLNSSHVSISYAVFCLKKKTSELQSRFDLVCRLLLEKKKLTNHYLLHVLIHDTDLQKHDHRNNNTYITEHILLLFLT